MRRKINIKPYIGKPGESFSRVTAIDVKNGKRHHLASVDIKIEDPCYMEEFLAFYRKWRWHPNFFRRWLFRIFGL